MLGQAQDQPTKKFQFGVSYAALLEEQNYKNPFSAYANYQIKKWDNIDLSAGFRTFYFRTDDKQFLSNKWGYNPNVVGSIYVLKNQFNFYAGIGYYTELSTIRITDVFARETRDVKFTSDGFSLNPGVKFFVHPNIFFDANWLILRLKTEGSPNYGSSNYLNLGLGVAF